MLPLFPAFERSIGGGAVVLQKAWLEIFNCSGAVDSQTSTFVILVTVLVNSDSQSSHFTAIYDVIM